MIEQIQQYRKSLIPDLLSGATGAVAGAPQAMGFAIVAGISPIYGLYTAIVATIVGSLTAGSPYMTIAPTNAVALVVGTTLVRFDEASHVERVFVLTLLVGVIQLAFGLMRLGGLTRFVSNAVMTGFITGAGLLIILGQLGHLTGYSADNRSPLPRFWEWLTNIGESNLETVFIGLLTMAIILTLHRTRMKNAAVLMALLVTGVFVNLVGWDMVADVTSLSKIPAGLPAPIMPEWDYVPDLLSPALALAILTLVQSAALVESIPPPSNQSNGGPSRDFVGQGIANIIGSVFQSMPSGGSLSRTAVSIHSGAQTRMANVFAGLFVALATVTLSGAIEKVVMAALAGHLIVAAAFLIRIPVIRTVWQVSMSGRLSMLATFVSTLVLPLEYSIYIGMALSLAMYIYSSESSLNVVHLVPMGNNQFSEERIPDVLPAHQPIVFSVYGNLFFAAVRRLEEYLPPPETADHTVVILRLRHNPYMGSTGLRFFKKYAETLSKRNSKLILAGISPAVQAQLERTGGLGDLGTANIFLGDHIVFSATQRALTYAEDWLRDADADFHP